MPPKKDAGVDGAAPVDLIKGFDTRDCKLLAAAFISSVGPDKYDYDLFAKLTGNTVGSLKKMWPPVKRKVIEAHETFGIFLGNTGETKATPTPKANASKKRKTTDAQDHEANDYEMELEPKSAESTINTEKKTPAKEKAPTKPRARAKKAKTELKSDSEGSEKAADNGDNLGKEDVEEDI